MKLKLRVIDPDSMRLIHCGQKYPYSLIHSEHLRYLEKKEHFVYWFQPFASTDPKDCIPALYSENTYYIPSLRMMKSIWRHIRLRKDFDNTEPAQMGGLKPKIPMQLLQEKRRTQLRFQSPNSCSSHSSSDSSSSSSETSSPITASAHATQQANKACMSAATKISRVIDQLFLTILESPNVKTVTHFDTLNILDTSLVDHIALQDPVLVQSKSNFLAHFEQQYDQWASDRLFFGGKT